ncbi:hypothetical protein [Halopiger djelfimassiliensis]|uniref:hypothetical protein n=1 Tax=Halopiger djelfimassiliensis TaxID=1293047 RepID=UPI000A88E868|nr:hypothetical protein [Halopiger djelfimassiliensis]
MRELPDGWQPLGCETFDDPYTEAVNDIREKLRDGEFVTAYDFWWYRTGRHNYHADEPKFA